MLPSLRPDGGAMDFAGFQQRIAAIYGKRDRRRGLDGTFRRLVEEMGELARALRHGDPRALEDEVSDVLAWTVSLASLVGVDTARAVPPHARAPPNQSPHHPCRVLMHERGSPGCPPGADPGRRDRG